MLPPHVLACVVAIALSARVDVSMFLDLESFNAVVSEATLECPYGVIHDGSFLPSTNSFTMRAVVANLSREAHKIRPARELRDKVINMLASDTNVRVVMDEKYIPQLQRLTTIKQPLTFFTMKMESPKDMLCLEHFVLKVWMNYYQTILASSSSSYCSSPTTG